MSWTPAYDLLMDLSQVLVASFDRVLGFLTTEYGLFGVTYTVVEWAFGAGLAFYLGKRFLLKVFL